MLCRGEAGAVIKGLLRGGELVTEVNCCKPVFRWLLSPGMDTPEMVAAIGRIEGRLEGTATRADVERLRADMEASLRRLASRFALTIGAAALSLVTALLLDWL